MGINNYHLKSVKSCAIAINRKLRFLIFLIRLQFPWRNCSVVDYWDTLCLLFFLNNVFNFHLKLSFVSSILINAMKRSFYFNLISFIVVILLSYFLSFILLIWWKMSSLKTWEHILFLFCLFLFLCLSPLSLFFL